MRWPLAGAALLFATGVVAGDTLPDVPFAFLPGAAFLAALSALLLHQRARAATILLATSLVLGGAAHLRGKVEPWSPLDLRFHGGPSERIAILRGTLQETPIPRRRQRHGHTTTNSVTVLAVTAIRDPNSTRPAAPATGLVAVAAPFLPDPAFRSGAEVEITGVLRHPPGPSAPGLFDYADYLLRQGIHFELRTMTPADWQWAPGAEPPPVTRIDRFRAWALEVLARGLDPADEEVGLLQAMTLGWKTGLTDELEEPFMRAGTLHVFAISGLHIALLAALAEQLVRVLLPTHRVGSFAVIVIAWLYTAATGLQPSAVRATLMTSCVLGGRLLERPSHPLNSLSGAALAILLWDPRQLFHAGFQLSFAVVGSLALLVPPVAAFLRGAGDPDPFLPRRLQSLWKRLLVIAWRHLALALAVALASWVGSAPLAATHFHLITLSGFLANLVVVPLSSAALTACAASLVAAPLGSEPVELFNHAAWFFMRGMVAASRAAAAIPETQWNMATPPAAASAAWYLLLVATGTGAWRHRRNRWLLGTATLALLGASVPEYLDRAHTPRLVVLPLSGGHALWFRHGAHTALVDTGDSPSAEHVTVPFLQAQGVNRLGLLALTHGDVRHTGGATSVVARCPVVQFAAHPVRFRSVAHRRTLNALESFSLPRPSPPASPWQTLHPRNGDTFPRADDGCLVLALDLPGCRVLHLGDLDRTGQELLLRRHPSLAADLLILAPPARGLPPIDVLLERLHPGLVIVADALHPATARASASYRAHLERHGVPVIYTSESGALDLRWPKGRLELQDARGTPLAPPQGRATAPARPPPEEDER